MVWSTKNLGRDREYIVLKHKLKDLNGFINGVKFRGGYGVVEKNSKNYHVLKKLPLIVGEQSLLCLRDLKFITRTSDVGMIFGKDVYSQYIKELTKILAKEEEAKQEIVEKEHIIHGSCNFRTPNGSLCKQKALSESPSGYCRMHILQEPRLGELGIEVPTRLSKDEKKEWKRKVIRDLAKLKKKGEF